MTAIVFFCHKFRHLRKKNLNRKFKFDFFLDLFGFVWVFYPFNCHCSILATLAKQLLFLNIFCNFCQKILKKFIVQQCMYESLINFVLMVKKNFNSIFCESIFSTYFDRENEQLREMIKENF